MNIILTNNLVILRFYKSQHCGNMTIKVDNEIILRLLERLDASEIFHAIDTQREYLGRWLPFVALTCTLSDTEMFVESVMNAPEERFELIFIIRVRGEFAGLVGFKDTDRLNKKTEIGYWLSERFQKQGIMTRSVEKLCEYAFNRLDINRIQIKCAVGNHVSSNIPKRLGFRFEGIERDGELLTDLGFVDLEVYSRLRSDQQ